MFGRPNSPSTPPELAIWLMEYNAQPRLHLIETPRCLSFCQSNKKKKLLRRRVTRAIDILQGSFLKTSIGNREDCRTRLSSKHQDNKKLKQKKPKVRIHYCKERCNYMKRHQESGEKTQQL